MQQQESTSDLPISLVSFDKLPDTANVRLPVVESLFACSPATVWRRVKAGIIPAPRKTVGIVMWNVRELRESLNKLGVR